MPKSSESSENNKEADKEAALRFRAALTVDPAQAEALLARDPGLINRPVYGECESALHYFATEGEADIVSWLLDRGASPDGVADDSFPLHDAALLGHQEVCRVLLRHGVRPDRKDAMEETALHKASATGRVEIVRALLAAGADPSIENDLGETPAAKAHPRKRNALLAEFDAHSRRSQPVRRKGGAGPK